MREKTIPWLLVSLIVLIGIGFWYQNSMGTDILGKKPDNKTGSPLTADLSIPTKGITSKASYYPFSIDGTNMEVLAVKASDGTIRTALNTCQVCYESGKGYYIQEGNQLICQNCGNRFKLEQVELVKGGCNPVPIMKDVKTKTDTTITISKDFLTEHKYLFARWSKS